MNLSLKFFKQGKIIRNRNQWFQYLAFNSTYHNVETLR